MTMPDTIFAWADPDAKTWGGWSRGRGDPADTEYVLASEYRSMMLQRDLAKADAANKTNIAVDLRRDYIAAIDLLNRIEPHIDAIVCYASTTTEHAPNQLAVDLRTALAAARGEVERMKKQVTSTALDALAADGQAHESYAAAISLRERLVAILDWCDLATDQPSTFNGQGVKLLQGPVFDAARKVVADHAIYAPKENPDGR